MAQCMVVRIGIQKFQIQTAAHKQLPDVFCKKRRS